MNTRPIELPFVAAAGRCPACKLSDRPLWRYRGRRLCAGCGANAAARDGYGVVAPLPPAAGTKQVA